MISSFFSAKSARSVGLLVRPNDAFTALIRCGSRSRSLRRATIVESLRVRTVIDVAGRRVRASSADLGDWQIPRDRTVLVRISDLHENPEVFPHPERFDPHRFRGAKAVAPTWLAFGGGARRCIGADFAVAEMDVVRERCCRTSASRRMPPPMRSRIFKESPTLRNSAAVGRTDAAGRGFDGELQGRDRGRLA